MPRSVDVTPAKLEPAALRDGQVVEILWDPAALSAAVELVQRG